LLWVAASLLQLKGALAEPKAGEAESKSRKSISD
jgi:hypothetical protein